MSAYVSRYSWKPGYHYKVSANTVGSVLKKIEEQNGSVSAKDFLEYSREETSETHSMFEWNDSVAAEKYRLSQSGHIINQLAIEIVYEGDSDPKNIEVKLDGETRKQVVSAYVNVVPRSTKASANFINTATALEDARHRKQVLANAMSELRTFRGKYYTLKELSAVINEIDKLDEITCESEEV